MVTHIEGLMLLAQVIVDFYFDQFQKNATVAEAKAVIII